MGAEPQEYGSTTTAAEQNKPCICNAWIREESWSNGIRFLREQPTVHAEQSLHFTTTRQLNCVTVRGCASPTGATPADIAEGRKPARTIISTRMQFCCTATSWIRTVDRSKMRKFPTMATLLSTEASTNQGVPDHHFASFKLLIALCCCMLFASAPLVYCSPKRSAPICIFQISRKPMASLVNFWSKLCSWISSKKCVPGGVGADFVPPICSY
jgi:hypothetical protein